MTKGMSRTETRGPAQAGISAGTQISVERLAVLLLIPKSCNCLSCLYMISLGGKAVTSSLPLSQEYFPHKANYCCIFLAAETLLLPIPRRSLVHAFGFGHEPHSFVS
ncbi:hypothetical protein V6N12_068334 [Hibiscus sabdariffa]|uniref:Uncharacterized protein n=1 Tax=Hibiscus sabdariffa TaxID=183260 RepID=A0ABR2FPZ8_9ROSI